MGTRIITSPLNVKLTKIIKKALIMKTKQFALPVIELNSRDDFARWFFDLIKENVESHSYDAFYDISQVIKRQHDISLAWSKIAHLSLPEEPHTPWILAIRSTGTFSSFDISKETLELLKIIETSKLHFIITFSFMKDYYHNTPFAKVQGTFPGEIDKYILEYEKTNIKPSNTDN